MKPLTAVKKCAEDVERAFRLRDEAIRIAHRDGESIRTIAGVAGLSSARVHQILHGR